MVARSPGSIRSTRSDDLTFDSGLRSFNSLIGAASKANSAGRPGQAKNTYVSTPNWQRSCAVEYWSTVPFSPYPQAT